MDPNEIRELVYSALRHPTPEFLTTSQAAAYLGVSKPRMEGWRCHGGGPPFTKLGRIVRYKRSELDAFMRAHQRRRTSDES